MRSPRQPKDQPLTQSLLRAELEIFTKETLRRELEDLKASLVKEVVKGLNVRDADSQSMPMTRARSDAKSGERRTPTTRPAELDAGLGEEGNARGYIPEVKQPLVQSDEENSVHDEEECCQSSALQEVWQSDHYRSLSAFVKGNYFESIAGCVVISSVMWLTVQTDYVAKHWLVEPPHQFIYIELAFLLSFTFEILLRLAVFGIKNFFCGSQRYGNWFDFGLVVIQLMDVMQELSQLVESHTHWAPLLRILRLFRIFRLVRIFRFFPDLRMLVVSVLQSIQPLMWVFVLIGAVTAVFAILITVVVTEYKTKFTVDEWHKKEEDEQNLQVYFGSVDRSLLSLYGTISGGRDWHESAEPLQRFISPAIIWVFVAYTFFVIFAMMNVITSQFVDQALEASAKDRRESMVSNLMDAFSRTGGSKLVSEQDFMTNLTHASMKSFLKDLYKREEVSPEEIRNSRLFEMLDDDGSGAITKDELILGCVRLTGSATSLDLAVLKLDVENLRRDVGSIVDMHRAEGRMPAPSPKAEGID